jgi:hypothetical protein
MCVAMTSILEKYGWFNRFVGQMADQSLSRIPVQRTGTATYLEGYQIDSVTVCGGVFVKCFRLAYPARAPGRTYDTSSRDTRLHLQEMRISHVEPNPIGLSRFLNTNSPAFP